MTPEQEPEMVWCFLPLRSACIRQPPYDTLVVLLNAYSDVTKCVDDPGMFALHYACGIQVVESVICFASKYICESSIYPRPSGYAIITRVDTSAGTDGHGTCVETTNEDFNDFHEDFSDAAPFPTMVCF